MPTITMEIPMVPTGQMRHRSRVVNSDKGAWVHTYKHPKQEEREQGFKALMRRELVGKLAGLDVPSRAPMALTVLAFMPVPKATSKKKAALMLSNEIKHTKKPDCTNIEKHAEDCMKGVVWIDDSQVWKKYSEKRYSERPRWWIRVEW